MWTKIEQKKQKHVKPLKEGFTTSYTALPTKHEQKKVDFFVVVAGMLFPPFFVMCQRRDNFTGIQVINPSVRTPEAILVDGVITYVICNIQGFFFPFSFFTGSAPHRVDICEQRPSVS